MARDKALGSSEDDDAIFDSADAGEEVIDSGQAADVGEDDDGPDDLDAVSEAIRNQDRRTRPDDRAISQAIKGVRLGNDLRAEAQPAAQPPAEKKADSVPLATFLEIERELRELKRNQQAPRQAPQQPRQPAPDLGDMLYTNPEGFVQTLTSSFESRIAQIQLDHDLQRAADKNSDVWDTAWGSFMERVDGGRDPALYQSVMNSRSPGQAIADWYRREQVLSTVGNDPEAYRQKVLSEALQDDAFVSQIAERLGLSYDAPAPRAPARAAAPGRAPNGQFQPASVTRLPTSLSRMSGRAAEADGDDGDGSDEAIFNAGRSRRR